MTIVSAATTDGFPLVEELVPPPDAEAAFLRIAGRPHALFLDSARRDSKLGRYSFLTADPFDVFTARADEPDLLLRFAERVAKYRAATAPELPPFQGGAAGLLSYELAHAIEKLPASANPETNLPALAFGWYDVVLAYDHAAHRAWIISHGFPETAPKARRKRAEARLREFATWLHEPPPLFTSAVSAAKVDSGWNVPHVPGLVSDFSPEEYRAAIRRAIDYIAAGDIFQVNLAQRLSFPATDDARSLYLRLRDRNPATFMGWFDLGSTQIVSASPERFVQVRNGRVETRPIKGTRPRMLRAEADLFLGEELKQSEKDRAENVMIVDLLRNDLSRVCRPESVRVTQLCGLETYEYVQHLVSAVEGELEAGRSAVDLIAAAFPGGSITGAPKVRAMEIIAELEPHARGAYCGSLGYFGFDGAADLSILIRTLTCRDGLWTFPVGGGITAASQPEREYEETWHKATGLLAALRL